MAVKNLKFKTETQKILHLVTHSLYSNRDIFLRELISNASDAIDKARFESLTNADILEGNSEWKIKIIPDKENNTITISDNGIGMNEDEVIENVGTIAKSGTQGFLELAQQAEELKDHPELIGQFGVGFYSSFMAADKVTLISRRAGDKNAAVKWDASGEEEYLLETVTKESRGTDVILHLNEDSKDYLEEYKIREIVTKYSDFIEFPITMDVERTEYPKEEDGKVKEGEEPIKKIEEETLNSKKAIWLRSKDEISSEEYEEFYKHISHDFSKPLTHMHYKVEGTTEFTSLLYLPEKQPFNMLAGDIPKNNIHLYVKRVFITKNDEALLPQYLRFVSGVVDSSDLPLNVSRESLQENRVMMTIKKNLVNKVLNTLTELKDNEFSKYKDFFVEIGGIIKEGVYSDYGNREKLLSLLLFQSSKTEDKQYISLDDYIKNMPEDQKEIFYITGETRAEVEKASHIEAFKEKNYEVLFLVDSIDEIVIQHVTEYKDKKLQSILKGDIDLGKKEEIKKKEEEYKTFIDFVKGALEERVKEVRLSDRLISSACCLVSDDHDMSVHMEKIMRAYNKDAPKSKRILEINPNHKVIEKMQSLYNQNKEDLQLKDFAELLYDQALITEGSKIPDPDKFSQRLYDLMMK